MSPRDLALMAVLVQMAGVSCASAETVAVRMPTEQQVQDYVAANWSGYAPRFARLSGQPWDTVSILDDVRNINCRDYYGFADCTFDLTAHSEGASGATILMSSTFEWTTQGQIKEVLVLVHVRKP